MNGRTNKAVERKLAIGCEIWGDAEQENTHLDSQCRFAYATVTEYSYSPVIHFWWQL